MSVPQIPHSLMSTVTEPGGGAAWVYLRRITVSFAVIRAAVTSDMEGAFLEVAAGQGVAMATRAADAPATRPKVTQLA
jgi:hypothetical protein